MAIKLVTCPETAHLEELTYEPCPLGIIVLRCTRWGDCEVTCARTCARHMDTRTRRESGPIVITDEVDLDVK
jgi:hypothetical protein